MSAAAQSQLERDNYRLTSERRTFLIEHAGKPGWSIETLARHFGVTMTVVRGWLERDDVNRAIIKRKMEDAQRAFQGDTTDLRPGETRRVIEEAQEPEPTPEPLPRAPVVSDETHARVARVIVATPVEPATPAPADKPRSPLTVIIEDLDDTLLVSLMRRLPASGEWTLQERDRWLKAFTACLDVSVKCVPSAGFRPLGGDHR